MRRCSHEPASARSCALARSSGPSCQCAPGSDLLLVAKRDRLGRDVIEVAMIERLITKRGARIVSAAGEGTENDDPSGILMRRLIDSFAEYERLIIRARTRAALAAKRRRGERISRFAPFGYQLASDARTVQ